jgi:hypothetical protein
VVVNCVSDLSKHHGAGCRRTRHEWTRKPFHLARIWQETGTESGTANDQRTFGSMRRLPSGRYQARYVGPTGETVTAPATFTARIDAEAWLAAERRQVEEPESWQSPKLRLEEARRVAEVNRLPILRDYAERWIDQRRNSGGSHCDP